MFRVFFYLVTFADGTSVIKGVRWNLKTKEPMDKSIPDRFSKPIKIVGLDGHWDFSTRDAKIGNDQLFN